MSVFIYPPTGGGSSTPVFDWDMTAESKTVSSDGAIAGLAHAADAYNTANGTIVFSVAGLTLTATAANCRLTATEDKAPTVGIDWATIDSDATDGDQYAVLADLTTPTWPSDVNFYWGGIEMRAATRAAGNNGTYWNMGSSSSIVHKDFVSDTRMSDTCSMRGQLSWAVRYTMYQGYTQDQLRLFMAKLNVSNQALVVTRLRVWKLT